MQGARRSVQVARSIFGSPGSYNGFMVAAGMVLLTSAVLIYNVIDSPAKILYIK
jgi:hypothetical protein